MKVVSSKLAMANHKYIQICIKESSQLMMAFVVVKKKKLEANGTYRPFKSNVYFISKMYIF